jgi:hypothetical protein
MSNALNLVMLSQVALQAGIDVGFNACGVERWLDTESLQPRIIMVFGDQEQMRKPRLRTPCDSALSYSEESPCIREQRQLEIPADLPERSAHDIRAYFVEHLLELV